MNQHHTPRGPSKVIPTRNRSIDAPRSQASVSSVSTNKDKPVSNINTTYSDIQVNRESIIFFWLDLQSQLTPGLIGSLRAVNDGIQTYADVSSCMNALQTTKEKVFFISSSGDEELISMLNAMENIEAIFVFEFEVNSIKGEYSKLIGVCNQHEELIQMLKQTLDIFQQIQLERFVFEEDNVFLWLQLWTEQVTDYHNYVIHRSSLRMIIYLGNKSKNSTEQ